MDDRELSGKARWTGAPGLPEREVLARSAAEYAQIIEELESERGARMAKLTAEERDARMAKLTAEERRDVLDLPARQPGCPVKDCAACRSNARREAALHRLVALYDAAEARVAQLEALLRRWQEGPSGSRDSLALEVETTEALSGATEAGEHPSEPDEATLRHQTNYWRETAQAAESTLAAVREEIEAAQRRIDAYSFAGQNHGVVVSEAYCRIRALVTQRGEG